MVSKIDLKLLRKLELLKPSQEGRPSFISAASGMTIKDEFFFVVADDELAIARFNLNEASPGQLFPLFPGTLPLEKKERKKAKPDLESLCWIDDDDFPGGALLSLPSGSKPNRSEGALAVLTKEKNFETVLRLDLSELFQNLPFQELNLEGALIQNENLVLFQRGNSKHRENAVLTLDLKSFLKELKASQKISKASLLQIHNVDLRQLHGFDLSFTDATLYGHDQILYLASTEDTDNPYDDGPFNGAVMGLMDSKFQIQWQHPLSIDAKPEGLGFWPERKSVLLVTDSDDAHVPACLFEAVLI